MERLTYLSELSSKLSNTQKVILELSVTLLFLVAFLFALYDGKNLEDSERIARAKSLWNEVTPNKDGGASLRRIGTHHNNEIFYNHHCVENGLTHHNNEFRPIITSNFQDNWAYIRT
jgi:hypothetical protein